MAMTVGQVRLWTELESFPLDHPAHEASFSERLRQEHGWTTPFASRVVREYRRFLLLAATEETLMVPSDAVDQAWHLHLVHTHAYWEELCGRVIHKALHHTPSRGGDTEIERRFRVHTRRRWLGIALRSTRNRQRTSGHRREIDSADVISVSIFAMPG